MKKRIPDRWEKYLPMGCSVQGTRFLPFKVPLKQELCNRQPKYNWFTPSMLMENTPMLKAVIDLTNTNRYYNAEEFTGKGVLYKKINVIGGGNIPPREIREQFFDVVDQLCSTLDQDSDALIGVHCTHGLNRTGYLICKYMVLRMKIDPQEAINKFQKARGYQIERQNYVSDIISERRSDHIRSAIEYQKERQNYVSDSMLERRSDQVRSARRYRKQRQNYVSDITPEQKSDQVRSARGYQKERHNYVSDNMSQRRYGQVRSTRGYQLERQNYVSDSTPEQRSEPVNWRTECRTIPYTSSLHTKRYTKAHSSHSARPRFSDDWNSSEYRRRCYN